MASSANALQAAIHNRLSGDMALAAITGANAVFDRRVTGRPMPYLVLSGIMTSDVGPGAEEHLVTIEAWSDAEGRKQAQEIAGRVKVLLDDAALELVGFSLVSLLHQSTRSRRETRTKAQVSEMVFRAVTE